MAFLESLIDLLRAQPWLALVCTAVLGLIVGSFLNVVVQRLPRMLERDWQRQSREMLGLEVQEEALFNLALPPSQCPACRHPLRVRDNLPLVGYLLLRGRCRHCHGAISPRYPLLEALTALLGVVVVAHFGLSWQTVFALCFIWALLALAAIDLEQQLVPDTLTQPLLWLGLLLNTQHLFVSPGNAIIGSAAGYLLLWSVYWIFKLLSGREGLGQGDLKLLAALGAWLGWQALPLIVLLSSLSGALTGLALIALRGRDRHAPLPFGPFLATAGGIALLWGQALSALLFGGAF
ncbi:MAG: A24 family peptidase [Pseudomonadales bacterium]|jgi:leader peptidase (prepilin peptidase)/N-methyltransferase|nr:A24 family peptidase [Pseudomonadales bacterium]